MRIVPPSGPARTRQLVLLGALLVAAAYAVSRVWSGEPTGVVVPASNSQAASGPAGGGTSVMPQPLSLEKLEPAPDPPATTRDPFRFGTRPAQPVERPAYAPPPGSSGPAAPAAPIVPLVPLKFIGRVVLPDRSVVAVLSDDTGNVLEGMEGQVVDGRYRIVRIGQESLVIERIDGTGRTTLALRGS